MDIEKTDFFLEYTDKPPVQNLYEAGRVQRYHANPWMARFGQTDADHQWGCAALLILLNPSATKELIKAAVLHDCGERWAGDLPYPTKIAAPEVAEAHGVIEHYFAKKAGIPSYHISDNEAYWLKFVDRLESHFYAMLHRPDVLKQDGFLEQGILIEKMAKRLEVWDQIKDVFSPPEKTMERRAGWLKRKTASSYETLSGGLASMLTRR